MIFCVTGSAGILLCGWLVLRHAVRTAALPPAVDREIVRRRGGKPRHLIRGRLGIAGAARRLRAEEQRQAPWEGRN